MVSAYRSLFSRRKNTMNDRYGLKPIHIRHMHTPPSAAQVMVPVLIGVSMAVFLCHCVFIVAFIRQVYRRIRR